MTQYCRQRVLPGGQTIGHFAVKRSPALLLSARHLLRLCLENLGLQQPSEALKHLQRFTWKNMTWTGF